MWGSSSAQLMTVNCIKTRQRECEKSVLFHWALGYEVFKTNKSSLNQMYDVPSVCSTANRKTNSFKDNVKVQNSKMGNSPQKRTHTHNNNSPKNKLNKKAQQNTKTLTKNREDRDSKDKDHLLFSFNILFCLTRRHRLVRKYKLW